MNRHGIGKYLLRKAFERDGWLPQDLLWRQKAAFSDAVGHSMVDELKEYAETKYSDAGSRPGGRSTITRGHSRRRAFYTARFSRNTIPVRRI